MRNLYEGATLASKGNYEDAIKKYREALGRSDNEALVLRLIGDAYLDSGDPKQAIHNYRKSINKCKDDPLTYKSLGDALCYPYKQKKNSLSDLKEAISHYEKAIYLNPDNDFYHKDLGEACLHLAQRLYDDSRCNLSEEVFKFS